MIKFACCEEYVAQACLNLAMNAAVFSDKEYGFENHTECFIMKKSCRTPGHTYDIDPWWRRSFPDFFVAYTFYFVL